MINDNKKLNVALIYPYTIVPPFGILSIASVLEKNGIKVKIIDYNETNVPKQQILDDINGCDVIGVSTFSMPMIKDAVRITRIIEDNTNAFLFWGGVHATLFPEKSINEFDLDCVVVNEGEFTVLELVESLQQKRSLEKVKGLYLKKKNKIIFTGQREPIFDMKTLPPYAWHLIDPNKYVSVNLVSGRKVFTLNTSRGCPYNCAFCYVNNMFGRRWRGRSPEEVVKEMVLINKKYNVTEFGFFDDLFFGGNKQEMLHFCDMIRDKNFKWSCGYRVNCVDYDVMKSMKRAGCSHIYFGVESGSLRILKMIRKNTTPEMIIKAIDITNKVGICCTAGFVGGFPSETVDDLKLTVKLAKKLKATKFRLAKYVPYPGSDLYDEAVKKGFRPPKKTIEFANLGDYKIGNLNLSEIPKKVLEKAKRRIEFITVKNSIIFTFKHGELRYLPYFILEGLPQPISEVVVKVLKILTFPLRFILKKR